MKSRVPFYKNKFFIIGLVVLLLVAGGGAYAYSRKSKNSTSSNTTSLTDTSGNIINTEPATAEDKASNDQHKDELINQSKQTDTASDSTGKKSVTPLIVSANATSVTAYVPGVFEDGGTCTATATNDSSKATQISEGFKNASYTQCAPLTFTKALTSGTWDIVVSYNSASAAGASAATKVIVP